MIDKLKHAIKIATGKSYDSYTTSSRKRDNMYCRMIFAYHCRKTKMKFEDISKLINRTHSTTIYVINNYQDEYDYNQEFKKLADKVEELIKK